MLIRLCICALVPRIDNATRLVLVIHHRELRKPTNSGALAARSLINSEMHVVGALGQPVDYATLTPATGTNLCLFPAVDTPVLTPTLCAQWPTPLRLIVPDGNWGQAGRMRRKLSSDQNIVDVTLPAGPESRYSLRREAANRPDGLATLEAIARALAIIEGPQVSEPLLQIFHTMVDRTLWSRGRLPEDRVRGGIPEPEPQ